MTVREVVTMGRYAGKGFFSPLRKRDRRLINEVLERTNIDHLSKRHLSQLSGGELHRTLLAQGLAQNHEILLLDEPATGLDLVSTQAIRDTVREEQAEGKTVVLSSHDFADAWGANHVILLAGRVVAEGPPATVLSGSHLTEAYGVEPLKAEGTQLLVDDPQHGEPEGDVPSRARLCGIGFDDNLHHE